MPNPLFHGFTSGQPLAPRPYASFTLKQLRESFASLEFAPATTLATCRLFAWANPNHVQASRLMRELKTLVKQDETEVSVLHGKLSEFVKHAGECWALDYQRTVLGRWLATFNKWQYPQGQTLNLRSDTVYPGVTEGVTFETPVAAAAA